MAWSCSNPISLSVDAENEVRAEMGMPLRTHYGGVNVFNKELTSKNKYILKYKRS